MKISVQSHDFDLAQEIFKMTNGRKDLGAIVTFTGLVRDIHAGKTIKKMTLEHFPGMAAQELEKIALSSMKRWPLEDLTIIHRYGPLLPGDNIVLVITTSHHREAAFEAAEYMMDWLKTDAPFWKLEETEEGEHWVGAKNDDIERKKKWQKQ
jgi:molybdopterin synthase catalytic subunit